ncbi:MAG: hypothetical protein DWQ05_03595 [Calditrichaeota bacterium]|nr:MAG: hypothetical protein DWQ05_03595 [Calditrichota bacterium]
MRNMHGLQNIIWILFFIPTILLIVIGCDRGKTQILVARIDNKNIYADELVKEYENQDGREKSEPFGRDDALNLLNSIIEKQIIFNAANNARFVEDIRIKKSLAKIRNLVYYRAALTYFISLHNEKSVSNQDAIIYGESQNLLRKYGLILNEFEIENTYREIRKSKSGFSGEEHLLSVELAEFNGGKIFLYDLSDSIREINSMSDLRQHIFDVARKKVFAVFAVKQNLHKQTAIAMNVEAEQMKYILEKYELVQVNKFLKSKNQKRVNISTAGLISVLDTMAKPHLRAWNLYRLNWIENLKSQHKIRMSEKGLQTALIRIQQSGRM